MGLGLVVLVAALTRLLWLSHLPPGLLEAAAANGLLARDATGRGLALVRDVGDRSPLLAGLIALAGRLIGFGPLTPLLGSALAGIATAALTALWLRRPFGALWGVVGGLIVAGGFWPLLFDRTGLSPAAGAAALAALLWLLQEAIDRPGPDALGWYALAGLAAGIGFSADPPLGIMPLLLVVAVAAVLWESRLGSPAASAATGGLVLTVLAALLTTMPFVVSQLRDPAHLAFWRATPGLPGHAAADAAQVLRDYGLSLVRLVWQGRTDPTLNLPGDPLLGWALAPWTLLGLALALRRARCPRVAAGLAWGALLLVPAALSDPGHPGRLLAALPLLVALPVAGMRAAANWSRRTRLVVPAAVLIVATLLGNAAWSGWRYFAVWAPSTATAAAFAAGETDSLLALTSLPPDQPVFYSTYGRPDLVRYLGPESPPRVDFDGRYVLPLPVDEDAWLVLPRDTPVDPALLAVFNGLPPVTIATDAAGHERYRIYRIDQRVRARLPFGVPTTPYTDGTVFAGDRVIPVSANRVAVVLTWRLPAGAPAHRLRVRFRATGGAGAPAEAEIALPANTSSFPIDLLTLAALAPPVTGSPVDLSIALLDTSGHALTAPGVDDAGYLLVDRFQFQR